MKNFIIGRDNFALTIFIPVDCKNNCPFCTSKSEYNKFKPNLKNVLLSIKSLKSQASNIKEVVITGGEPFADLGTLDIVITFVKTYLNVKDIYINTSLPMNNIDETIKYINNSKSISGINISRHIEYQFVERPATIQYIKSINKRKRINCVISDDITSNQMVKFANEWLKEDNNIVINFRADYRKINFNNLHSENYPLYKKLNEVYKFNYCGGCNVCHTDYFNNGKVQLHRGIELSHIERLNNIEINDLIIKQDGSIRYDWDKEYTINNINDIKICPNFDSNFSNVEDKTCGTYGGCGGSDTYEVYSRRVRALNSCGTYGGSCGGGRY